MVPFKLSGARRLRRSATVADADKPGVRIAVVRNPRLDLGIEPGS